MYRANLAFRAMRIKELFQEKKIKIGVSVLAIIQTEGVKPENRI